MMHDPAKFYAKIREEGFNLFTGVPDSLLKDFCAYVTDHAPAAQHVITANEGNAVALALGHYLGTKQPAVVYLQNSGVGNTINPLLSLADSEVYGIPMLLLIGWRGEPGIKDEPQHIKQGRVMTDLLDAMEIPWYVVGQETTDSDAVIAEAAARMRDTHAPVALLVRKGTFAKYQLQNKVETHYPLNREACIELVVGALDGNELIVSTTGMASRELYEYRARVGQGHSRDFLTVGGMGHTASIALGLARSQPGRQVICLDGDGSALMHLGALAVTGQSQLGNLIHIVINNGAHDSVGGQPTAGFDIDLIAIARACGYAHAQRLETEEEIIAAVAALASSPGPSFLEIRVNKGSRSDLGRPQSSPAENRDALMTRLGHAPA